MNNIFINLKAKPALKEDSLHKLLTPLLLVLNSHRLLPFRSRQFLPLLPLLRLDLILYDVSLPLNLHPFLLIFYLAWLFLVGIMEL